MARLDQDDNTGDGDRANCNECDSLQLLQTTYCCNEALCRGCMAPEGLCPLHARQQKDLARPGD